MPEEHTLPGIKGSATDSNSSTAMQVAVIAFGVGGHAEQARRVVVQLSRSPEPSANLHEDRVVTRELILITEASQLDWPELSAFKTRVHTVQTLREKHSRNFLAALFSPIKRFYRQIRKLRALIRRRKPQFILSTGPGIALPVVILGRLYGVRTIHIETWSRFTTRSLTGRCMYRLADEFWVQNEELLKLYPNAEYVGRL